MMKHRIRAIGSISHSAAGSAIKANITTLLIGTDERYLAASVVGALYLPTGYSYESQDDVT